MRALNERSLDINEVLHSSVSVGRDEILTKTWSNFDAKCAISCQVTIFHLELLPRSPQTPLFIKTFLSLETDE